MKFYTSSINKRLADMFIISMLPKGYAQMAIEGIKLNDQIQEAYSRAKRKHGAICADKLMIQFKNEAFAGKEVNSDYIIRRLNDSTNLETIQEQTN